MRRPCPQTVPLLEEDTAQATAVFRRSVAQLYSTLSLPAPRRNLQLWFWKESLPLPLLFCELVPRYHLFVWRRLLLFSGLLARQFLKPLAVCPSSGASLQSNFDDPDGWNSDVSQTHTVPNTINPGEGEAAEHASVLPSVSKDVYATWKRRNRQTQRRHVKVSKHAEREAKRVLVVQLEIIHATALQTLQARESRSVQILWQTLWLKHLRTILQENGGPA